MELSTATGKKVLSVKVWKRAALLACVMAAGFFTSQTAPAQAADPVTVGVLDESKLGKDFVKYRSDLDDLNKKATAYDSQLDAREVMTDAEGKRFEELLKKPTRVAAEETEFQNLFKTGSDRRRDLNALIGKATRTPEEDARMKEVQGYMNANKAAVRRLEDDLFQELKTAEDATNQKYIDMANEMVKKVAVEKKLTIVLRKDGVVWAVPAIDITEEVLSRLNR
jgi:Skp family chaperone for outer membrane proteins